MDKVIEYVITGAVYATAFVLIGFIAQWFQSFAAYLVRVINGA